MYPTPAMQQFPLGAIENPKIYRHFPTDGLRLLDVNVNALGSLYICFDAEDDAVVIAAGDTHLLPQRIERRGKALVIEGNNFGAFFSNGQVEKTLIEVHVPRATKLHLRMMGGLVILDGGTGDVDIKGWAGQVTGVSHADKVKVRLYAGEVSLNDLHGKAAIQVWMGNLNLEWSDVDGEEDIQAMCGLGKLDLVLPKGVASTRSKGGFGPKSRIKTEEGTRIKSWVGLGDLEVLERTTKQKRVISIQ